MASQALGENTSYLVKYPFVLYVKSSNKPNLIIHQASLVGLCIFYGMV